MRLQHGLRQSVVGGDNAPLHVGEELLHAMFECVKTEVHFYLVVLDVSLHFGAKSCQIALELGAKLDQIAFRSWPVRSICGKTAAYAVASTAVFRRTARSRSSASGSANCSPKYASTKRPPRISPRASMRRSDTSKSRHGGAMVSR